MNVWCRTSGAFLVALALFAVTSLPLGTEAAFNSTVSMKFCYIGSVPTIATAALYTVREELAVQYDAIQWSIKLVGQNGNAIVRDAVEAVLVNTSDCDVLLGPGSSIYSITLSQVTTLPWMDFGSTSDALSDAYTHPWFSRVIPTDGIGAKGIQALLDHYQWTKAHIVCTDEAYGQSLAAALEVSMKAAGVSYTKSCVHSGASKADLQDVASKIKSSDYRIVVVVMAGYTNAFVNFVDVVASDYGLNTSRTFVYSESICSGSDSLALIKTNFAGGFCTTPGYNFSRMQELHSRLVGSSIPPTYAPEFSEVGLEYKDLTPVSSMTYSGFTYDAYNIDAIHHCMGALDAAQRAQTFDKADTENTRMLLRASTVQGMSGTTTLNADGDRVEVQMDFHTIQPETGLKVFGTWDGKQTVTVDASVNVYYNTEDGLAPTDTTTIESETSTQDLTERNLIITFSVLGALVFIALLMFIAFKVIFNSTRNAPTDSSKPFVLIVTDIEKSTSLWNQHQGAMRQALETHNKIIRQQIVKHGCYEVMTQGDSFTIATKDVQKAISLTEGIQLALYKAHWQAEEIDTFYQQLDQTRGVVPSRGYQAGWNGLRVRIALHFDKGSALKTESGYQYGGNVALGAKQASAFAFGGQIVLTSAVFDEVHEARKSRCRELNNTSGAPLTIDVGNEDVKSFSLYDFKIQSVTRAFPASNAVPTPSVSSGGINPFVPRYPSADPGHSSSAVSPRHSEATGSTATPDRNLDTLKAVVKAEALGGQERKESPEETVSDQQHAVVPMDASSV